MAKPIASPGLGSLRSGAITALSLAVQTGLAALVGVIVAHKFGRNASTDGFFEAYGVFVVLGLAATASRITVLPSLARARDEGRLASELAGYALAGALVVVPLVALSAVFAHPLASLLTGFGPQAARDTAAATLPWMIFAAACQLLAGFAASALAAIDNYGIAAAGFAVGSVSGLALIVVLVDGHGIQAVAWGMALNGAVALGVPVAGLARRARHERMPRSAARPARGGPHLRLGELAIGCAFPLAMQIVYVICLPLASHEGVGAATSFSYAYLIGSAVVAVTASSLGLVTSVTLSRANIGPEGVSRHIVASSWIAFLAIGAVAGIFSSAGGRIAGDVLGSAYSAHVGDTLGQLVVVLAPWMALSVGYSVAYPVLFAASYGVRLRLLSLAAVGLVVVHLGVALALRAAFGLNGLGVALAITTALALVVILAGLHAASQTARGLLVAAAVVAGLTLVAFGPVELVLGPFLAAGVGLVLYVALLGLVRPAGLGRSLTYLRTL